MAWHNTFSGLEPVGLENESHKLTTLLQVGQALTGTLQLLPAIEKALGKLDEHLQILGSAVTLLRDEQQDLAIVASSGISSNARGVRYRVGEGVTGQVGKTGKPIIVPRVSLEPTFLNRAVKRKSPQDSDISFICVPIVVDGKPVGTLSVDLPFASKRDYESCVTYFSVVASLFSQAVKINRLVRAERQQLIEENDHLRGELQQRYDFSNIIGTSGPMRTVYEQVTQVARTSTTVMIRGESGTGKELIAHAIHYNSERKAKPFIKVNCSALPDTLIESELFGYERGAFTGANAQKKGRFDLAEGGSLFLDEIGELNASTAVKLLRVLQEREFERLGGTQTIKTNVRLIVATNKDLEKAVQGGVFRADLYYRMNVFTIFMPPLRERRSDILLLADYFLEKYSNQHARQVKRISTPAIDMLMAYHWPGNVRELENVIERAVVVCDGSVVHGHHLPPTLQTAEASGTVMSLSLKESVDSYEKDILQDTLKTTRGNCARAAALLQTTERIFNYKLRKYQIDLNRFRLPHGERQQS